MNIEEIKDRVNLTKNAFHKLGIEGQVNINVMLNDIEFLLTAYEKEKETSHYNQSQLDIANAKLVEEKEKTEYEKELRIKYQRRYDSVKEKNSNAKWYIHQEIVRIEEDIEDYLDDDKEGNKQIIGEFKEDLEHWKDVEKLLDGKSKDKLYMDWRKYGEYE